MKKTKIFIFIIIVIIVIFFMLGPFYIIPEGEQSVLTRFGKIVQTQINAGLKIRLPFIDKVVRYSKKILSWDGESQRIPTFENSMNLLELLLKPNPGLMMLLTPVSVKLFPVILSVKQ